MEELGAPPASTDPNAILKYTLPVIYDPNQNWRTGTASATHGAGLHRSIHSQRRELA
ncbi:hypothetical protein CONPUDRAFT_169952, partial [Coniophora puteana RWD-64-598 SS2]